MSYAVDRSLIEISPKIGVKNCVDYRRRDQVAKFTGFLILNVCPKVVSFSDEILVDILLN